METVYGTTQMTELNSVNDEKTFKYMSIYYYNRFQIIIEPQEQMGIC